MRISHEAIYQALFVQGRGALRRELTACLRTGRVLRMPRARTRRRGKNFVSSEIMISQRPVEVADRAVPGHWEDDLILGLGSSAIGTLVERKTRFTMLLHLPRMIGHGKEARIKNGPALAGHPKFRTGMTLDAFKSVEHAVADATGMAHAIIDRFLTRQRVNRNVTLRVPGLHVLPMIVANSDLLRRSRSPRGSICRPCTDQSSAAADCDSSLRRLYSLA